MERFTSLGTTTIVILLSLMALFLSRLRFSRMKRQSKLVPKQDPIHPPSEATIRLIALLSEALPGSILLPDNVDAFKDSMNRYWAKQECEAVPSCVIRPQSIEELSTAVTIIKGEYDRRVSEGNLDSFGIFAVRSGGHSPVAHAASIHEGVLIDLSWFNEVTPSEDAASVTIGTGAKWGRVYAILDRKHLGVVGGRNSAVGVGGLVLGGGMSFFSQRFGLTCSNVIQYTVVLASGTIVTASSTSYPKLWRALKGGSNNFGIVTHISIPTFPLSNIWSGFLYLPSNQVWKILNAFHSFIGRADPNNISKYDENASGPIACFTYLQQMGIQAISINLVYTKSPQGGQWPECWRTSGFKSLWRLWSTCKTRTLEDACDEMNALNPPGRRQTFGTTTIRNDRATIQAAHDAYAEAIPSIKRANVKGMSWTLVLQPLLPDWVHKGDPNPLGLHNTVTEPLVYVSFTVNWLESADDEAAQRITREAIERIDAFAKKHGTGHRYRYLNYCGDWQKPFQGYGADSLQFLQDTSKEYDPDGLFQRGCVGGFKLDI